MPSVRSGGAAGRLLAVQREMSRDTPRAGRSATLALRPSRAERREGGGGLGGGGGRQRVRVCRGREGEGGMDGWREGGREGGKEEGERGREGGREGERERAAHPLRRSTSKFPQAPTGWEVGEARRRASPAQADLARGMEDSDSRGGLACGCGGGLARRADSRAQGPAGRQGLGGTGRQARPRPSRIGACFLLHLDFFSL